MSRSTNEPSLFDLLLAAEPELEPELELQPQPQPLSVSELNEVIGGLLTAGIGTVWVEGEVVDFRSAASGHWYFNLNDGTSQIKCVCWKGTNFRIRFKPKDGVLICVRGKLNFWAQKGELKLSVDSLEPSGEGALAAAFEQIFAKLDAEGLFAPELKRPLPFFPRRIGVVTSRTGAAFHDILTVLTRRARSVSILLAPALVQGEGSADSVRRALIALNEYNARIELHLRLDAVIVGRGGGSSEDLWAFNDEALARAIRASEIPVISAVGHEIDTTIADHAADVRAATPSDAAALVAAREEDILTTLQSGSVRLTDLIDRKITELEAAGAYADERLSNSFSEHVRRAQDNFRTVAAGLSPSKLSLKATRLKGGLDAVEVRLDTAASEIVGSRERALGLQMAKLDALSPLAVLTRGYSITQNASGEVLRDPRKVADGEKLKIRLEKGTLNAKVFIDGDSPAE